MEAPPPRRTGSASPLPGWLTAMVTNSTRIEISLGGWHLVITPPTDNRKEEEP